MAEFSYQPLFEPMEDKTLYRKLPIEGVSTQVLNGKKFLTVTPETMTQLCEIAFDDISHLLRTSHLEKVAAILKDPEASSNDYFVAIELLKNAVIAAERIFPSCQDTGTALVVGKKGESVLTFADDAEALSRGIFNIYQKRNLRYSQLAPLSMYEEKNTLTNLPAQIEIYSEPGNKYEFLFIAKGGGSANKSYLFQKNKSLLNPKSMEEFVKSTLLSLGTAACPPYHLALVIGGTSAEHTLKTVKLASCGYYDHLVTTGNAKGRAYRDLELEKLVERWGRETKIGAQFGGKYFVHDVRVIRLPRHGASCPVGLGVSCAADRQIKAKITEDGVYLEQLETDPARFLPGDSGKNNQGVAIDLNRPMKEILETLGKLPVSTRVMLNGPMIVARDIAHAKLLERLQAGKGLPDYLKNYAIYYAGPAKTPKGHPSGSFGPTTSQRMDSYVPLFQKEGASLVMLGKGNRTKMVAESCKKYGGFYLGSIGGPAARLGKDCITKVEVHEYPELGMEAVWKIEVKDFPAFIIVDNKGNDFFAGRAGEE
ncbi:MAG: fumarate hydratase [Deltaproteobacteria bacterium]|nr:fumarate hydratase [Deltaproteobacteria bacterium]MBM4318153.1 fumarate hydratase [Deltaproteobacteria bacterium]